WLRSFVADYGVPLMVLVWTALSYSIPSKVPPGVPRRLYTLPLDPASLSHWTIIKVYPCKGDAVLSYKDPSAAHSVGGFYNNHDLRGYKINVAMAEKSAPRDPSSFGHGYPFLLPSLSLSLVYTHYIAVWVGIINFVAIEKCQKTPLYVKFFLGG
ncbi:hypothetical protein GIB67_020245, partial [Kingdonia uniflora]